MVDPFSASFGEEIRTIRRGLGLSQEDVAERSGLDRTFISMVERGAKRATLHSARRIADAVGKPLSEIIRTIEDREVRPS